MQRLGKRASCMRVSTRVCCSQGSAARGRIWGILRRNGRSLGLRCVVGSFAITLRRAIPNRVLCRTSPWPQSQLWRLGRSTVDGDCSAQEWWRPSASCQHQFTAPCASSAGITPFTRPIGSSGSARPKAAPGAHQVEARSRPLFPVAASCYPETRSTPGRRRGVEGLFLPPIPAQRGQRK